MPFLCGWSGGREQRQRAAGAPAKGRLGAGAVASPRGAAGAAGEGCCFDLGTGWTCPSPRLFIYPARYPGRGRPRWLLLPWLLLKITAETTGRPGKPIVNTLISIFFRDTSPSDDLGRFQSAGTSIPRICGVAGIGVPLV